MEEKRSNGLEDVNEGQQHEGQQQQGWLDV